jgi:hypothetical protein
MSRACRPGRAFRLSGSPSWSESRRQVERFEERHGPLMSEHEARSFVRGPQPTPTNGGGIHRIGSPSHGTPGLASLSTALNGTPRRAG